MIVCCNNYSVDTIDDDDDDDDDDDKLRARPTETTKRPSGGASLGRLQQQKVMTSSVG